MRPLTHRESHHAGGACHPDGWVGRRRGTAGRAPPSSAGPTAIPAVLPTTAPQHSRRRTTRARCAWAASSSHSG